MIKALDWITFVLLIIGGIDLGFVGLFNYDLIIDLFGDYIIIAHIFFSIIGLAALYMLFRMYFILRPAPLVPTETDIYEE